MSALEPGKAGTYELTALQWDKITSKPSEPLEFTRYVRGDKVTLNSEDALRLWSAGAVAIPGEREKAAAAAAHQQLQVALGAMTAEDREAFIKSLSAESPAAAPSKAPRAGRTRTPSPPAPPAPPPTGPSEPPSEEDDGEQPPTGGAQPPDAVGA